MKKILLLLFISLFSAISVNALSSPILPFCEHQGYLVERNPENNSNFNCVFEDGNKCDSIEFYKGECGFEYRREFPCRKTGEPVFTKFEHCCEGNPYSEPYTIGAGPTCQPSYKIYLDSVTSPTGLIIIALLISGLFLIKLLKKFKKN